MFKRSEDKIIMTIWDVQKYYNIKFRKSIYRLIEDADLPSILFNNRRYFLKREIDYWFNYKSKERKNIGKEVENFV